MNFYISCRCDDSENSGSFVKNDKLKREREKKETVCFHIFRSEGLQSNCVFGRNNLCSTQESDTKRLCSSRWFRTSVHFMENDIHLQCK